MNSNVALYRHPDLSDATDEDLAAVAWQIEQTVVAGGHRVVSLVGGPWGETRRVRIGKKRALFSWVRSEDSLTVWVHEVGWRREIYDRATGVARSKAWMDARDLECLDTLGYLPFKPSLALTGGSESVGTAALLPALSEEQAAFVRSVIPLDDDKRDAHVFVFMAKGPPGSGKTVVAADVARDAFLDSPNHQLGQKGADVLVLVPSGKLQRQYREEFRPVALAQASTFARADSFAEPRIWVERFIDFFAAFGAAAPSSRAEQANWWAQTLEEPSLRRWAGKHECVKDPRFVELLDACFDGDESPGGGAKDPLSAYDRPMYDALARLERSERATIRRTKQAHGVCFRWEVAAHADKGIAESLPGRSLVVVVDEAQDLLPVEWQCLVRASFLRHRNQIGQTVVALLGDENQRVAPTAFAWSDVDAYARTLHDDLADGSGTVMTELTGSFRIRREIARVANTLMEGPLVGDKARRAPVAQPDGLARGGSVVVIRCEAPGAAVVKAVASLSAKMTANERLVHIGPAIGSLERLDSMDAREAKGLEFPMLVATSLFEGELNWDARSRAYVAITRAREKLAVVLEEREWQKVAAHWSGLVTQEDVVHLEKVLEGLFHTTGIADSLKEQLDRIDNLVDDAEHRDAPFPLDVLERGARLIEAGAPTRLLGLLDDVLRRRPAWEHTLRSIPTDAESRPLHQVAAWLLLGDLGAAILVASRVSVSNGVQDTLREFAAVEGALPLVSIELRTASPANANDPLASLVVAAFWAGVAAIARDGKAPAEASSYKVTGRARSDVLAKSILESVDAATNVGVEALKRFSARLELQCTSAHSDFGKALAKRRSSELLRKHMTTLDDLTARAQAKENTNG